MLVNRQVGLEWKNFVGENGNLNVDFPWQLGGDVPRCECFFMTKFSKPLVLYCMLTIGVVVMVLRELICFSEGLGFEVHVSGCSLSVHRRVHGYLAKARGEI